MNHIFAYRSRSSNLLVDSVGLIAVIVLALFVRFHPISVSSIWYDEAFSLLLAKESPGQIWSITARDVHPPLYYVLLHYWMLLFGDSVLSARSLSALADVGTLLLSIKLMSLVATRRATWIAALLLALLPISVRYSQEVRMYTLVSFWLMGATVALVCWVKAPDKKRFPTIYVLLMTAAFYTHYFAALCVLVHWLFWWQARGIQGAVVPVRAWMLANSAIVVLFLPWVSHFIQQLLRGGGLEWILPLTWQTVLTIVWQFTATNDSVPVSSWWRVVPTLLILVCAVSVLVKDRSERHYSVLLVGYFFVPVIALFFVALLTPVYVPRYLLFAAVGLPLIVAVGLDSWWHRQSVLAAAVLAIFFFGEVQALLPKHKKMEGREVGLDEVVASISLDIRPDDEILIDGLFWYLPFMYYNTTGIQPRIHVSSFTNTLWGYPDQGGWALIHQRVKWIVSDKVSVLRPNTRRVWWVTGKALAEDTTVFPKQWKKTLSLEGGGSEARLFTLDAAPPPLEAGVRTHPSARQYNPWSDKH